MLSLLAAILFFIALILLLREQRKANLLSEALARVEKMDEALATQTLDDVEKMEEEVRLLQTQIHLLITLLEETESDEEEKRYS